jgi:four helix bundle protein
MGNFENNGREIWRFSMMGNKGHRGLIAWEKAMELIPDIYHLIKRLPREERYGLSDQMRRAVISIAANIAEGHGRNGKREFTHYLGISQGSASELDTLLDATIRLQYLRIEDTAVISEKLWNVRRLIFGLRKSLKEKEL